jgi:hypothetical protein
MAQATPSLLLAGADVVHLASALLEHGPGRLSQILDDMKTWMIEREYESVAQLKGSMCQTNLRDASALARQSYIRVLDSFTPRPGCGACPARQLHPAGALRRFRGQRSSCHRPWP